MLVDGKINNHALYQLFRNFPLAKAKAGAVENGSGCVNVGRNNVKGELFARLLAFLPAIFVSLWIFC
jgi:hypothetical protein